MIVVNPACVSGPIFAPIFGEEPVIDTETGESFLPKVGVEPGARRNVAAAGVTGPQIAALSSAGVEIVSPSVPLQIFAGDVAGTIFLLADDEDTMLAGLLAAGLAREVPDN